MESRAVQRIMLNSMVSPLIAMSRLLELLQVEWFRAALEKCVRAANDSIELPSLYHHVLWEAEDHRNALHPGVDAIAMLRAAYVKLTQGEIQGASTVEQQFVRVITCSYERTLQRKFREQLVALALKRYVSRERIASAYLCTAYFGSFCEGIHKLSEKHRTNTTLADGNFIVSAVARLKYPEPLTPDSEWHTRISIREKYIHDKMQSAANNQFKLGQGLPQPINKGVRCL